MSYGSLEQEKMLQDVAVEMSIQNDPAASLFDPDYPFGEEEIFLDDEFWLEARETFENGKKNNLGKAKAQRITRARWLLRKSQTENPNHDLLVYMLTEIHDKYKEDAITNNSLQKYPTFVFELSEFTLVLLEFDNEGEKKYNDRIGMADGSEKTILHLAAERNLHEVVKYIIEFYPSLVNITTTVNEFEQWYPLHFALNFPQEGPKTESSYFNLFNRNKVVEQPSASLDLKRKDETASLLIQVMESERVQDLFQFTEMEPARFHFKDYITNEGMNKTVIAILDCLMNPDWPFIPVDPNERDDYVSCIPNMPIRYHFYYRLLDGDDEGQAPTDDEFKHGAKTCLQLIAERSDNAAIIQHPAVRLLVRRKWNAYGRRMIKSYLLLYTLFLIAMSVAFFIEPSTTSTSYKHWKDILRLVCEISTLFFTLVYFLSECIQLFFERCNYFKEWSNYFDLGGMALILAIVPLRLTDKHDAEMIVSAAAFFINFLRIFKYFAAFKNLGIYSKTFSMIIYSDISKFAVVFFIVMFSYTGAVFLILKATNGLQHVGDFWVILLQQTRAITEGQGFADDYGLFKPLVVVFLMLNMFSMIVILLNVLIGQISYRYEKAIEDAIISYDIDRTKYITRIESSLFPKFWNRRVEHYQEGDFFDSEEVAEELMQDWLEMKKQGSIDKKQTIIEHLMKRRLKNRALVKGQSTTQLDQPE